MSIKPVCPQDKEHNVDLRDKFCKTCGVHLKFQSFKCPECNHAEYPSAITTIKFCPKCGCPKIELITTETQEDY